MRIHIRTKNDFVKVDDMKKTKGWTRISFLHDNVYCNGDVYTDLDEPLRLTHRRMSKVTGRFAIWTVRSPYSEVLLATHQLSDKWGEPVCEKMPFDEAYPLFCQYVRMMHR